MKYPRIKSPAHVSTGKMSVFYAAPCVWIVASGLTTHDTFPTHAEAITFAQREALKAVAAKFTLPPEPQEPTC